MEAKEFFQNFITKIYSGKDENGKLRVKDIYKNSSRYTGYIKNIIENVLYDSEPPNNVEVNCEYYHVDIFA